MAGKTEGRQKDRLLQPTVRLTLSGLHDEGNSLPPGVVDPQGQGCEGRADGSLGDGVVLEVTRLAVGTDVLTEQGVLTCDCRDASEDLDLCGREIGSATGGNVVRSIRSHLFVTDVLGAERDGPLHCQQGQGLQQV